jgi:hypothetical protein
MLLDLDLPGLDAGAVAVALDWLAAQSAIRVARSRRIAAGARSSTR